LQREHVDIAIDLLARLLKADGSNGHYAAEALVPAAV